MSDTKSPQDEREEDIGVLEVEIEAAKSALMELEHRAQRTRSLARADEAELDDMAYEQTRATHYIRQLEADLENLKTADLPQVMRSMRPRSPVPGLAVIVGHSAKGGDPGATGTGFPDSVVGDDRKEVHWNTELSTMIKAVADERGLPCEIFTRDSKDGPGIRQAYRDVRRWGCRAAVELHFNFFEKRPARGTETLYVTSESKAWARLLQDNMIDLYRASDPSWRDRDIKIPAVDGRLSLTQLSAEKLPVALIEPFFGDTPADAQVGQAEKAGLASSIVDAYAKLVGKPQTENTQTSETRPGEAQFGGVTGVAIATAEFGPKPAHFFDYFYELLHVYSEMDIEFPHLKGVSFSQWAHECGYGKSDLAQRYMNFGGMKYRPELADLCTPADYTDWANESDAYCNFVRGSGSNVEDRRQAMRSFVTAYWRRFDATNFYPDWRKNTGTPEQFIRYIGPIYAKTTPGNKPYATSILNLYRRLGEQRLLPIVTVASAKLPVGPTLQGAAEAFQNNALSDAAAVFVREGKRAAQAASLPQALISPLERALSAVVQVQNVLGEFIQARPAITLKQFTVAELAQRVQPGSDDAFKSLIGSIDRADNLSREAKLAIVAHWAIESDWGRSPLAQRHYNFAGMEWGAELSDVASEVPYPGADRQETYCRFVDLEHFLTAYWRKIPLDKLKEAQDAPALGQDMARLLAGSWRPTLAEYPDHVAEVARRLAEADKLPRPAVLSGGSPVASPNLVTGLSGPVQPGLPSGLVIRVKREQEQIRSAGTHRTRTVGSYQVFEDGRPLQDPRLSGTIAEQKGPGDNTVSGRTYQRRIQEGIYPLFTHGFQGSKYKTHGYSPSSEPGAAPPPAIRVGDTGRRIGILLHPGRSFLSSTGCLNFSRPLPTAQASITWSDSRQRAITLIGALGEILGSEFPSMNGRLIKGAHLFIEGEPVGQRSRLASLVSAQSTRGQQRDRSLTATLALLAKRAVVSELFALMADTMNGEALPDVADASLFDEILKERAYLAKGIFSKTKGRLSELTGPRGETLWEAWSNGWETSEHITDTAERIRVQGELKRIAERLKALGVDVNMPGLFQTPLSAAAAKGAVAAVKELIDGQGADVNAHDPQGNSPLISAAFAAAGAVVHEVLSRGADVNALARDPDIEAAVRTRALVASEFADANSEQPPRHEDAAAAARAGLAMLGDPAELVGSDLALYSEYLEILQRIEARLN